MHQREPPGQALPGVVPAEPDQEAKYIRDHPSSSRRRSKRLAASTESVPTSVGHARSQAQAQAVESRVQVKSRRASVTFSLLYRTQKKLAAQGSGSALTNTGPLHALSEYGIKETQLCFSFFDFLAFLSFLFFFSFLCFCSSVILADAAAGVC